MPNRVSIAIVALALASIAIPASAGAAFKPGAESLGDSLFPQIGNGGYDARHYAIDLRVDPGANRLEPGTRTVMTAVATQDLSRFSLDFQRDLPVSAVSVNGVAAGFSQRDAKPRLSLRRKVTQPAKLIVTPTAGLPRGAQFSVEVVYSGLPEAVVDTDLSIEGWVRACSSPGNCDGSITVNEPIGAQSWFPSNNYATDKASVATTITTPATHVGLGAGELVAKTSNLDGTVTWSWSEDDPTAPYLLSATVGRFDYDERSMLETTTGAILPIYGAIDSAAPAGDKQEVRTRTNRIPEILNFFSKRLGPYPFDSIGYVADWVPAVGYALENQTKPHFAGDEEGPFVSRSELIHEVAHQWMGDSISARHWSDIWFNEGWATISERLYNGAHGDRRNSAKRLLRDVLASEEEEFELAPASLDGDPANLFSGFAVYSRPGAMLEGYRQIVGNRRFFGLARRLGERHRYGTINRGQFIREARRASGLGARESRRLARYFRQWLLREGKPTLTPADFRK